MTLGLPAYLEEKISPEPNSGCWLWTHALHTGGYGAVHIAGTGQKVGFAHRVVFEHLKGPIPTGKELDHKCRVRSCCNPDHVEPVTHQINASRGDTGKTTGAKNKAKTVCKYGHALANARLYRGRRHCRTCSQLRYNKEKS